MHKSPVFFQLGRFRGRTIFVVLDEMPQCLNQHQRSIRSLDVQLQKESGVLPGFPPNINHFSFLFFFHEKKNAPAYYLLAIFLWGDKSDWKTIHRGVTWAILQTQTIWDCLLSQGVLFVSKHHELVVQHWVWRGWIHCWRHSKSNFLPPPSGQ